MPFNFVKICAILSIGLITPKAVWSGEKLMICDKILFRYQDFIGFYPSIDVRTDGRWKEWCAGVGDISDMGGKCKASVRKKIKIDVERLANEHDVRLSANSLEKGYKDCKIRANSGATVDCMLLYINLSTYGVADFDELWEKYPKSEKFVDQFVIKKGDTIQVKKDSEVDTEELSIIDFLTESFAVNFADEVVDRLHGKKIKCEEAIR